MRATRVDSTETAITEILKTQFSSRSDAYHKKKTSITPINCLLSNDSYTYFWSYSEFVDVPGEHGTTGEDTGIC